MYSLSRLTVRYRKLILTLAVVFMATAAALGADVSKSLSTGGFQDPEAEATIAALELKETFGASSPSVVMVITAKEGSVDAPEVVAAGTALTTRLAQEEGVAQAASYWSLGFAPQLRSADGSQALAFVTLSSEETSEVLAVSERIAEAYRGERNHIEVMVGGQGPLFAEVQETVESDLTRAEMIALPITLALLLVVFGSVVAALLPLGIGVFAIVGTLLILESLTAVTEVSIFALNQTTAMGLALAIDYSLFVVSRYREELASGFEPHRAVERTVQTAGRTVLFSAGAVGVALAAMLVFPLPFLRSFGWAGIAVASLAAVGAVMILPALLAVLGHRVDSLAIRKVGVAAPGTGAWHRMAQAVMRRPWPITVVTLAVLILLGSPFLRVDLGRSDDRVLGTDSPTRATGDLLREGFSTFETSPVEVVATGIEADREAIAAYAAELSGIEGVERVDAATGTYREGEQVAGPGLTSFRFIRTDATYLNLILDVNPLSDEAEAVVDAARGTSAPFPVQITGVSADLVDTKAALFDSLGWALGLIGAVTVIVLFLMFGSVLIPIKAVALNLLSLSATFGALVWIFQEGNLSGTLTFTPTGSLELTMPVLIFCIAFGLSMDYEVFLLSRIKEEHDLGKDNVESVASGLERTGRIVTAAALLMAVVFIAFSFSGVSFMKMFGIGMTLAVLVDAFIIRATLVPAFMRLAGSANWWAPGWLRRVHRRVGLRETSEPI